MKEGEIGRGRMKIEATLFLASSSMLAGGRDEVTVKSNSPQPRFQDLAAKYAHRFFQDQEAWH